MCRNPANRSQARPNHKKRHQETAGNQKEQRVNEENERGDADHCSPYPICWLRFATVGEPYHRQTGGQEPENTLLS